MWEAYDAGQAWIVVTLVGMAEERFTVESLWS